MNTFRENLVVKAFSKFDRDGNGHVDYDDLKDLYNAKFHPDFKAGKKTEQQCLNEWLNTFQMHHNLRDSSVPDNVVTLEEFIEYYANVSCSIDLDSYFKVMITNAWDLDNLKVTKKGWSNGAAKGQS